MTPAASGTARSGKRITPDDIEAKLRDIQGEVEVVGQEAMNTAIMVGAAIVTGVVVLAFVLGRRRGRKRRTVLEVRRV